MAQLWLLLFFNPHWDVKSWLAPLSFYLPLYARERKNIWMWLGSNPGFLHSKQPRYPSLHSSRADLCWDENQGFRVSVGDATVAYWSRCTAMAAASIFYFRHSIIYRLDGSKLCWVLGPCVPSLHLCWLTENAYFVSLKRFVMGQVGKST